MKHVVPSVFCDDFVAQFDEFTDALAAMQRTQIGLWGSAVLAAIDRQGRQSRQATVDAVHVALGAPRVLAIDALCQAERGGLIRTRSVQGHYPAIKLTTSGRAALESARLLLAETCHANLMVPSRQPVKVAASAAIDQKASTAD